MSTTVKPIPDGYHTLTPSLTFKDSSKALEFYQSAFGAQVLCQMPGPTGRGTMHAVMKIGDSIVMMGDGMPNEGCSKSAESMGGSPMSLYLYVPNVDEAFEQAASAGATVTMPVMDMFWGDRCGNLTDPFGYSWMVATHIKDPTQEEIERGSQDFFANCATK